MDIFPPTCSSSSSSSSFKCPNTLPSANLPEGHGLVFVLSLERGKYFVGSSSSTEHISALLESEFAGKGSMWTRCFRPLNVEATIPVEAPHPDQLLERESLVTLDLMKRHGVSNVRGSVFQSMFFSPDEARTIEGLLAQIPGPSFRDQRSDPQQPHDFSQLHQLAAPSEQSNSLSPFRLTRPARSQDDFELPRSKLRRVLDDDEEDGEDDSFWNGPQVGQVSGSVLPVDGVVIHQGESGSPCAGDLIETCESCGRLGHWANDCFVIHSALSNETRFPSVLELHSHGETVDSDFISSESHGDFADLQNPSRLPFFHGAENGDEEEEEMTPMNAFDDTSDIGYRGTMRGGFSSWYGRGYGGFTNPGRCHGIDRGRTAARDAMSSGRIRDGSSGHNTMCTLSNSGHLSRNQFFSFV